MFGYVRPLVPELKVSEYEYYKGVYCGLCRSLGKNTGCASRFALNYDLVFLALVRMAVLGEEYSFCRRRCAVHPLKKRPSLGECRALAFCAHATAMFTSMKIEDNMADSRGIGRVGAAIALPYGKHLKRKAGKIDEISLKVSECLSELSALEKESCASIDRPAELFGRALALICSGDTGEESSPEYRICYDIGFHLGRFIYIADAADDYDEDKKSGSYNPIIAVYGSDGISDSIRKNLYEVLLLECRDIYASASLLDYSRCPAVESIIKNIIKLGMPAAACRILGVDPTGETDK
ncbi:MAG: hypothetical protein IKV54_04105 [Clostridia bacterium]|nr:hypothetical protein [Clostridia bacterium]